MRTRGVLPPIFDDSLGKGATQGNLELVEA